MRADEFERLYAAHAKPLFAFLIYRTGDPSLSEDLVADTFERVLTARRPFDPREASEKTWLYSIAMNLLRDHARRAAAGQRAFHQVYAVGPAESGSGELEALEARDAVHRALAEMPAEEREVIALRYGADLTIPEIAKLLRQRRSTVHGRVYRALGKLQEQLERPPG